jgi:ABC1 atypical kinase-like domain
VLEPVWILQPWGDEIGAELGVARSASREPIEPARIERVLRHAWGVKPTAVLDELDLEHESMTQRRFHRALRDHPLLMVPAPVTRLAREGVSVNEWVDGAPLSQAPDRDGAALAGAPQLLSSTDEPG